MDLISTTGDELRLSIQGYQYPDAAQPAKRYSWHMISGSAHTADQSWTFRYPALTCDESPRLARWLRRAADWLQHPNLTRRPDRLDFTEPTPAFDVVETSYGKPAITVTLDLEFRSPSHNQQRAACATPKVLTLTAAPAAVRAAASDWDSEFRAYPDGLA